jgi:hypothetical protein
MANSEHLTRINEGVIAWNKWRLDFPAIKPDLSGAYLGHAHLTHVNLRDADLSNVNLSDAQLIDADLQRADLRDANLQYVTLLRADLRNATLAGADLYCAHLWFCSLLPVDFTYAKFGYTVFSSVDLSKAKGIETVTHIAPSTIGIDTIYSSAGLIPDVFLRDAGVPEEIIDVARSIRAGPAIQWHSCFISYSTKDEEFARRLHSRMREANMRVWFAPEDLKGGEKLYEQLFKAI